MGCPPNPFESITMAIIKATNLTKKFKELTAVDNISLEIEDGECYGLLGPNGAGKTTLIRMLTAVSPVTSGDIWVMGKDLKKAIRLEEKKDSAIDELSGGMKRRLLIGRGLVNDPKIIILDEPSIGLDPQARYVVWQKLRELKSEGVTQLICTQNMEEAARLCDRVAIINQGKIIDIDTPRGLVVRYMPTQVWEIDLVSEERDEVISKLESRQMEYEEFSGIIHVFPKDNESTEGLPGVARQATLEDVFFKLTGRTLAE